MLMCSAPTINRLADGVDDATREIGGVADIADRLGDDDELVATEAGHEVTTAQADRQAGRDLAQDLVADLVTVTVVDCLELVEIDEQQRGGGSACDRHGSWPLRYR